MLISCNFQHQNAGTLIGNRLCFILMNRWPRNKGKKCLELSPWIPTNRIMWVVLSEWNEREEKTFDRDRGGTHNEHKHSTLAGLPHTSFRSLKGPWILSKILEDLWKVLEFWKWFLKSLNSYLSAVHHMLILRIGTTMRHFNISMDILEDLEKILDMSFNYPRILSKEYHCNPVLMFKIVLLILQRKKKKKKERTNHF